MSFALRNHPRQHDINALADELQRQGDAFTRGDAVAMALEDLGLHREASEVRGELDAAARETKGAR